jgi:DNA-binding SARP family transcriptional activator/tetratricopeptide (TPR) repeat protein
MSTGRARPTEGGAGEPAGSGRRLRFSVLGPLRAWRGEQPLDLGPVRQQALLAALLLRPDATVSRQELLDSVWGLEPPGTGAKVVPVYVHRLRKCLRVPGERTEDSVIGRSRSGYRFAGADVRVDSARLEEIVAEAGAAERSGDLAAAVDAYAHAVGLFEGEPLTGLPGPFAAGERVRLTERRIALSREKVERQLRLGWHAEAVGELSVLIQAHPHSESLAVLSMRALYGSGRRADALTVFTELRRRLVEDLGVEPAPESRRLHQAVLRGDDAALGVVRGPEPATRPAHRARNELPADVGELIGRDEELALLTTPTGAGTVSVDAVDGVAGAGKTALAVRAAHLLRARYPDGCLFLNLHGHTESREALVPQRALRRLLRAVGVDDNDLRDDLDELAAAWRSATAELRLLVVLDDVSSAEQARPLLPTGPGSRVLVTSRPRLTGLDVDRRISLGPLELDEAAELLSRIVSEPRARREWAAARGLAKLCGQLPLALRIAGARLQNRPMWTFEYLVERWADDERRLSELTVEDRGVEAALMLSYEQLPVAQRRAFRLLGRCPTVEPDRLVLAAMLDCPPDDAERVLESLVDANLVQQPAVGRYRLHDLVAVFARRLAAADPAEEVVGGLRLYVAAARCASDEGVSGFPTGPEPTAMPFTGWADATAWLDTMAGELIEVVAYAAAAGEADYACWITEGLVDYFIRQGRYHECRTALEIALSQADQATDRRMASSLRIGMGLVHGMRGHYAQAAAWGADALQLSRRAGDLREQARALGGLGMLDRTVGRDAEAIAHLTEVVELARRLADDWLGGTAICNLGAVHQRLGQHEEASDCFAYVLALAEKAGSPRAMAKALCYSGGLHLELGRYPEAAAELRRAVDTARRIGDVPVLTYGLTRLGTAEQGLGNVDTALDLHRQALSAITEQTATTLEMEVRNRLGESHLAAGDLAQAQRQFELVLTRTETNPNPAEHATAHDGLNRCRSVRTGG